MDKTIDALFPSAIRMKDLCALSSVNSVLHNVPTITVEIKVMAFYNSLRRMHFQDSLFFSNLNTRPDVVDKGDPILIFFSNFSIFDFYPSNLRLPIPILSPRINSKTNTGFIYLQAFLYLFKNTTCISINPPTTGKGDTRCTRKIWRKLAPTIMAVGSLT